MEPPLTYREVGATREASTMPTRSHRASVRRRVGTAADFDAAAEFVLGYGMQRGAGIGVSASDPVAREGTRIDLLLRVGPLRFPAPARVVYVLDEPDRRGFAYGTLPGHPESGEELFAVVRVGPDTFAEVRAFSWPGRWFTRLGGPVVRRLQRWFAERYVEAVRRELAGA